MPVFLTRKVLKKIDFYRECGNPYGTGARAIVNIFIGCVRKAHIFCTLPDGFSTLFFVVFATFSPLCTCVFFDLSLPRFPALVSFTCAPRAKLPAKPSSLGRQ